jgi:quinol monooxygenase YgiN
MAWSNDGEARMSEPIVFISRGRVKQGKLEEFKRFYREGAEGLKREKPGTVAFLAYVSDDGAEVSIVHVFPDAEAMDRHMQGVSERAKEAYQFIESAGMEIYGTPNDGVLQMMRQIAGSGLPISVRPQHLGGYLRLTAK